MVAFVGSIGNVIWLVVVEPGTVTQLVLMPTVRGLVCSCNVQPVWPAGQVRVRLPPLITGVIIGATGATVATLTVPFPSNSIMFQVTVRPGVSDTTLLNAPL